MVYPAIDLRGGVAVRLQQGDPTRQEMVAADPVEAARRWAAEGAAALHVVDLDGAFAGAPVHLELVGAMARAVSVPVRLGGGLRTVADIAAALAAGVDSVVVGTRALEADFLQSVLDRWGPERVVVGLDARGDEVAVAGWRSGSGVRLADAAAQVRAWGAAEAVFTQVQRDGMLSGPDLDGLRQVVNAGLRVVASGGVSSAADVAFLAALEPAGVCGAILGRALYAGRITLAEALRAAASGGAVTGA